MSLTHDAWRAGRCLALALLLMILPGRTVQAQGADGTDRPTGVSHYDAYLEPDPAARTLKGLVLLTVTPRALAAGTLTLDRGDLTIDRVEAGGRALRFELAPRTVQIPLPGVSTRPSTISVRYHGAPRAGLLFFPERRIIYTIFSTSHWMVAEDAPASRATFRLRVVVPRGWTVVGNGRERSRRALSAQADLSEWLQDRAVPTYTFGFVAGELTRVARRANGAALEYVGQGMSPQALDGVFGETARMIDFFRSRAGVDLPGGRYAQVVVPETIGQEMAGFAVVSADYARGVLADPTTNTLLAHELAHQWWGNMVTCRAWTHFWLNEGFATFMSAAYREQRFGRAVYLQDVEQMRSRYERVRAAGRDRALVFPEWSHPTADDRTIVYQKGAYVLHRLREALGETPFWAGVALYTRRHMGRSVTTDDFRRAMEEASRRDLAAFFAEWVDLRR